MYFPYLRGRQYELIALRELVEKSALSERVIPIIEPVKLSSTLIKTIGRFSENGKKLALIINPQVGSFREELENESNTPLKEKFFAVVKSPFIIETHLFNAHSEQDLASMMEKGTRPDNIITICRNRDFVIKYGEIFTDIKPQFNLILDESVFRRRIRDNRVLLKDNFVKAARNRDYADNIDEPFSDDHIYYKDDGYKGFADYTVIGDKFTASGFAPHAVAIHIVYFDEEKSLRIRHFVSDTNDDITDTANKFAEAVSKLVKWNKWNKTNTIAMETFVRLYEDEKFPGLGIVKKLSIMHHIELIGKYLDERKER